MGLAEPDEQALIGPERCLQLVVQDLLSAAASASSAVGTTSATVTADLGSFVELHYTKIQQRYMA
jgi:hypothetical protein